MATCVFLALGVGEGPLHILRDMAGQHLLIYFRTHGDIDIAGGDALIDSKAAGPIADRRAKTNQARSRLAQDAFEAQRTAPP